MYELMGAKKEDDEFVLQIAHSLNSLLTCQATRSVLLDSTQVPILSTVFGPYACPLHWSAMYYDSICLLDLQWMRCCIYLLCLSSVSVYCSCLLHVLWVIERVLVRDAVARAV